MFQKEKYLFLVLFQNKIVVGTLCPLPKQIGLNHCKQSFSKTFQNSKNDILFKRCALLSFKAMKKMTKSPQSILFAWCEDFIILSKSLYYHILTTPMISWKMSFNKMQKTHQSTFNSSIYSQFIRCERFKLLFLDVFYLFQWSNLRFLLTNAKNTSLVFITLSVPLIKYGKFKFTFLESSVTDKRSSFIKH